MDCREFIEGFSDYADGLLSETERAAFDTHRERCPECARYARVLDEGRTLLQAFSGVPVDEDFDARLESRLHRVRDEVATARSMGSGGSTTAVLSIAAVLLVVAWSPLVLFQTHEVELAPIWVTRPAPRPVGAIRLPPVSVVPASTSPSALELDRDLWAESAALFAEYAPIRQRYRAGRLLRASPKE